MAPLKCCVGGCNATSDTHRLFTMPMNDNLRNLWMSLIVPTNPGLLGLTKEQLINKRVCERHFDETQFDQTGIRIRYSYPCLFTEQEIIHGVPLTTEEHTVLNEHNYCRDQEHDDNPIVEPVVLVGMPDDVFSQLHQYALPSTSQTALTSMLQDEGVPASVISKSLYLEETESATSATQMNTDLAHVAIQQPFIETKKNIQKLRSYNRHNIPMETMKTAAAVMASLMTFLIV